MKNVIRIVETPCVGQQIQNGLSYIHGRSFAVLFKVCNIKCILIPVYLYIYILGHAKAMVNELGTNTVRDIREWYQDLINEIGKGKTRMQRAAKMGRAERIRLLEDDAENTIIPLNQAILLWYESSYREELKQELQNTAMKIRLEQNIKITSATYNR